MVRSMTIICHLKYLYGSNGTKILLKITRVNIDK